jgi:hypothetical protein
VFVAELGAAFEVIGSEIVDEQVMHVDSCVDDGDTG